jgi:hypothetical protein
MLGIAGPTLVSFVVPMAVGAVAGLLAGLAARQVGNRARAQRQSKRLVMVARRRTTLIPPVSSPDGADS